MLILVIFYLSSSLRAIHEEIDDAARAAQDYTLPPYVQKVFDKFDSSAAGYVEIVDLPFFLRELGYINVAADTHALSLLISTFCPDDDGVLEEQQVSKLLNHPYLKKEMMEKEEMDTESESD